MALIKPGNMTSRTTAPSITVKIVPNGVAHGCRDGDGDFGLPLLAMYKYIHVVDRTNLGPTYPRWVGR